MAEDTTEPATRTPPTGIGTHACGGGPRCWAVTDWIALMAMLSIMFIVVFCCFFVPKYWSPIEQVVAFFLGVVSGALSSRYTSIVPHAPQAGHGPPPAVHP